MPVRPLLQLLLLHQVLVLLLQVLALLLQVLVILLQHSRGLR